MKYIAAAASIFIFVILCLAFIIPLVAALSPLWTIQQAKGLVFSPLFRTALYTVQIAGMSMLIALSAGLPAAFFIAKRRFFGKRFFVALSAVPLVFPPLLIALGFVISFGINGLINRFLAGAFNLSKPPLSFLYSFWGIVIAQGFYNFPLVMKICSDAWSRLPEDEANAARILGASEWRIFCTISLYQLMPAIMSASILVFLYCFFSFIIVLLFGSIGGTTLEVAVYQAARADINFRQAAFLALAETSLAFILIFFYARIEKKSSKSRGLSLHNENTEVLKASERLPFLLFVFVVSLFFLLPLFMLIVNAFSGRSGFTAANFYTLFKRQAFWLSIVHSLETAFFTAGLSVAAALVFASFMRLKDPYKTNGFFPIIPLLPLSVSSVVMGFGMTMLINRGNPCLLVLAQAALIWPLAFRQISAAMDRIPHSTLEAARLLSPHLLEGIFRVQIPLCRKSIVSAFGFCFAASCGDASLPLVLAIPRYETLALFTYRLAGSYRFSEACAAGLVLIFLTAGVFLLGEKTL